MFWIYIAGGLAAVVPLLIILSLIPIIIVIVFKIEGKKRMRPLAIKIAILILPSMVSAIGLRFWALQMAEVFGVGGVLYIILGVFSIINLCLLFMIIVFLYLCLYNAIYHINQALRGSSVDEIELAKKMNREREGN